MLSVLMSGPSGSGKTAITAKVCKKIYIILFLGIGLFYMRGELIYLAVGVLVCYGQPLSVQEAHLTRQSCWILGDDKGRDDSKGV